MLRTSVTPEGKFLVGLHRPAYSVMNLREHDSIAVLGHFPDGTVHDNRPNFPPGDVQVDEARWIYEIPNAFPFRGTTYIDADRAAGPAADPAAIRLAPPPECSLRKVLNRHLSGEQVKAVLAELPPQVLYALAANSTDPEELTQLARLCCRLEYNGADEPVGLQCLRDDRGRVRPDIDDLELFETIANNPHLPDAYKDVMVLRPGAQGDSEIVGEWRSGGSHVFEYLRRNSYIPWGHFAPNMANDAIRYSTADLSFADMQGLRHLYYQRIYVTLAGRLGIDIPGRRRGLSTDELEDVRQRIIKAAATGGAEHQATLWGWNFGYDFSASGYRLHASHQMIHQQCAMVPESVATVDRQDRMPAYSCGDLVAEVAARYHEETGSDFFNDFLAATRNNERTDRQKGERSLVVWEDRHVMLFVPKAQVSQWELQLMVTADSAPGPVGNVVEADSGVRQSIDRGILLAQKIYAGLGARMVTSIEFSKRLDIHNGQRLFYSFLPKLPWAMGAFSEAQLRFICGHFPEDFAVACRRRLAGIKIE
ncbi:hypothetical protein BMS3Bbin14_00035 [bacterium BMS3Bbin14]|nr:hypothetical protein BMS3Abin13_02007 [bacterium BMS3Abin13]GBE51583.1 hypothetical protein BMS3Bbin14_00035 [bacterium BMS3Bbin14]HDK43599.1 hypothetical protein [Desulfobacteraceae bacterium]HDO30082.1 hypothetical protein [Desulfobacteraceae bacterium]